jgi:hypothetical protein
MKLCMGTIISILDFLRIATHLIQVKKFQLLSTLVVHEHIDHYNVLKLYFLVMNVIVGSNVLSKSGFCVKIRQFYAEILLTFRRRLNKIKIFRKKPNFTAFM